MDRFAHGLGDAHAGHLGAAFQQQLAQAADSSRSAGVTSRCTGAAQADIAARELVAAEADHQIGGAHRTAVRSAAATPSVTRSLSESRADAAMARQRLVMIGGGRMAAGPGGSGGYPIPGALEPIRCLRR